MEPADRVSSRRARPRDRREPTRRRRSSTATSSPDRTPRGTAPGRSRWPRVQAMSARSRPAFRRSTRNALYLTGLSGGARVALQVALGNNNSIAGVIASSAGYPDSKPRAIGAVRALRHRRHRRLQLRRDASARSQADLAASAGGLQRRPHAAARRRGARGDRVDGAAGDEVRPASAGRRAHRTAVCEAAAADRVVGRAAGGGAPARSTRRTTSRAPRRVGRDGARRGSVDGSRR